MPIPPFIPNTHTHTHTHTHLFASADVGARYEAYGWHVTLVEDGDSDVGAIVAAIEECKAVTDKPSLIRLRTTIGFGSAKEGTESVHGSPLRWALSCACAHVCV